jgi:putative membrane protein
MKAFALALASAALATGAPALAAGKSDAAAAEAATSSTTYVRMAGSSDMYEKESSQFILSSAQNADVRRFAEMMVGDHTNTTAQLLAAAKQSGITADPKLLTKHAQLLRQLRRVGDKAREKTYMRQQVMAHEEALALHQAYAARGDNAALRQVATAATPIVQAHLTEARRIADMVR